MRVINRQQLFAAFAHCALGGEEIFRRGFVSDQRITRDISHPVNSPGGAIEISANQTTAFVGASFASVRDDFIKMSCLEVNYHVG